jgi:hypothetical protein
MSEPPPPSSQRPATARVLAIAGIGAAAIVAAVFVGLRQWATPPPAARANAEAGTDAEAGGADDAVPSFDIVRVGPRGGAVIAGHAAPGSEVRIEESGRELGRAQAGPRGDFVFVPSAPLPPGPKQFTLTARTPDGREARSAGSVLAVVPDRPAGPAPVAVLSAPDRPLQVLQSRPGDGQALGLDAAEREADGTLRLAGRAPPGSTVRVYVDDRLAGDATADAKGTWAMSTLAPLPSGEHQVRLDQLNAGGRVEARALAPLPDTAALPAGGRVVVVRPGQTLWRLARDAYGNGLRYTVLYQANREQIRDPSLIYPGQRFEVPAATARR